MALGLPGLDDHWKDAKGASVSLLGPANPGGSKGSYSLLLYVCGTGGTDNTASDCALWSLQPSYLAT